MKTLYKAQIESNLDMLNLSKNLVSERTNTIESLVKTAIKYSSIDKDVLPAFTHIDNKNSALMNIDSLESDLKNALLLLAELKENIKMHI